MMVEDLNSFFLVALPLQGASLICMVKTVQCHVHVHVHLAAIKERGFEEEKGTIRTSQISLKLTSHLPEFILMVILSYKGNRNVSMNYMSVCPAKVGDSFN